MMDEYPPSSPPLFPSLPFPSLSPSLLLAQRSTETKPRDTRSPGTSATRRTGNVGARAKKEEPDFMKEFKKKKQRLSNRGVCVCVRAHVCVCACVCVHAWCVCACVYSVFHTLVSLLQND